MSSFVFEGPSPFISLNRMSLVHLLRFYDQDGVLGRIKRKPRRSRMKLCDSLRSSPTSQSSFIIDCIRNSYVRAARSSDGVRIFLQLMRDLPHLDEKKKEKPLCYPYSLKARALLHAHFSRLKLPPDTLEYGEKLIRGVGDSRFTCVLNRSFSIGLRFNSVVFNWITF